MNDPVRERMLQGQAQAADPQPWRCSTCNTPIRPNHGDMCPCLAKHIPPPKPRQIEFDDKGPDEDGRRRFTLFWDVKPRLEIFRGEFHLLTRRAQCFHSAQWRKFLAEGYSEVPPGTNKQKEIKRACSRRV